MKLAKLFLVSTIAILVTFSSVYAAKEKDKKTANIFEELDEALEKAKLEKADILSPKNYEKAEKAYQTAKSNLKAGKDESLVKKDIKEAQSFIKKVNENVELSKLTLGKLIAARENAISASAPQYALSEFKKADNLFIEAAKYIEDGNVNKARKVAEKAKPIFKKAEKKALREGLLGDAKNLKKESRKLNVDDYAPKVLEKADKKLQEVESYINSKEYEADTAKKKAEETKYEYRHAINLSEHIKDVKKKKWTREDIYLNLEKELGKMSKNLGLPENYDKRFNNQLDSVKAAIDRNNKDREDLNLRFSKATIEYQNKIADLNKQITEKDKEIARLKGKTEEEAERLNTLRLKLEKENSAKEKYETIKSLFTSNEGKVLKDGSHIILQLYGITFPSGKSIIESKNYDLLSKVQKSIREYPNAKIIIEGHTDSVGDKKLNEILSEERAKSVKSYLIANNTIEDGSSSAIGYGSSRPVASNKTREGRARNRRIDIIIRTE